MNGFRLCCTALVVMAAAAAARAEVVTLTPIKDNTLYESSPGALSNGAGRHFFAGRTGQATGSIRRAVLAFNVAGNIPPTATINQVTLTLHMSRTEALAQRVSLHRVLADWGEGTSAAGDGEGEGAAATPGDVTWIHTFFATSVWTNPGGDFSNTASASRQVTGIGSYNWGSTPQMVADVQGWLDQPATNFGWILIGNEAAPATAKRFDSRENSASVRPRLRIDFTNGGPTFTPTATLSPTRTRTLTPTPTQTLTSTRTRTPTRTVPSTRTHTPTLTPTPSNTPTPMPTNMPTVSPTRSLEATPTSTPTPITCNSDCNGDGVVLINELILCVNIALDSFGVDACEACDPNGDGRVEISEVVPGVNNSLLDSCIA